MSDRRTKGLSALPLAAVLAGRLRPSPRPRAASSQPCSATIRTAARCTPAKSKSPRLQLDLAPVAVPSTAFARTAAMEYDEVVIDYAFRTGMIPKRFAVDELFNDLTATLV